MRSPDVVIAGAGLIGLACALECERRGLRVTVLERGRAGQEASSAAAGMLAAHDPANPKALSPLAELSLALYPQFLGRVRELAGCAVPIETEWTLEQTGDADADIAPAGIATRWFRRVPEQSLDPRKLIRSVSAAVGSADIVLMEQTPMLSHEANGTGVSVHTSHGTIACGAFLDCKGAWSTVDVRPAKGQMLRVHAPGALHAETLGNFVLRTENIYMVPRLDGSVVIGATVEDAGFDKAVHDRDLADLRRRAAAVVPGLQAAPLLESWAGLRPDTPDHLPLLGATGRHQFVAGGHFRNGILLAPATARLMVCLLMGEPSPVDLAAFDPRRFSGSSIC